MQSNLNIELFCIPESATVRDAMDAIEHNAHGFVLVINSLKKVIGIATDGDIRRWLLAGGKDGDAITSCHNVDFIYDSNTSSRELLLKRLDMQIRFIPILDADGRLEDIVSREFMPLQRELPVYARARSPARVSFGGGGSDLTAFFAKGGGAVINSTISLFTHATLRRRMDNRVIVFSLDLGETAEAENLVSFLRLRGNFGLVQAVLKTIRPDYGFELYLNSDYPMKSGLGGSAVVASAILGCFNQFRSDQWDQHELAELAFQAERLYLGIAGGWQDQYATVFGGFNFMEFKMEQNIVHPLRVKRETILELEESLVLCDTGLSHDSGAIHKDQRKNLSQTDTQKMVQANVDLTYEFRNHLLRGRLHEFGQCLHRAWMLKRQFSAQISTPHIDEIYQSAIENGALGGKILGAGGGGFFLFYVPPFRKHQFITNLRDKGLKISPFRFDSEGLSAWSVRENGTQENEIR